MRCAFGISLPTKKLHLTRKRVAKRILKTRCTQCIILLKIAHYKNLNFVKLEFRIYHFGAKFQTLEAISKYLMIYFLRTIIHCLKSQVNFKGDFRSLESFHFLSSLKTLNPPQQNFEKHTKM